MQKSCAFIVIDSGFSQEVLKGANLIAAWDLTDNRLFETTDGCLSSQQVARFAGDPMGHGSIVLSKLRAIEPDAKLILIKAFGKNDVCRTQWESGRIVQPGWVEGYVWAVRLAESRGMVSVANCSFGGYHHAMDSTGWEAMQVGQCTGAGKPGHIVVAAAGYGDARPVRGSLKLLEGESKEFIGSQEGSASYNFWFGLGQESIGKTKWELEAWLNDKLMFRTDSDEVPANIWNGKQQLTFSMHGSGSVQIEVRQTDSYEANGGLKVDVWAESARFYKWISTELMPEPACFNNVISVGLRASSYGAAQEVVGAKPEILLPGSGQISFRLPEVVVAIGRMLEKDPGLDLPKVKLMLPKFW